MNEIEVYQNKEDCRNNLQDFLRQYFDAADEFDMSDEEKACEISNLFSELGKNWDIITD